MTGFVASRAAAALLRALVARSGAPRADVLVTYLHSRDWRSLTFAGEQHRFGFRVLPPHADAVARRMIDRIEDAEFTLPATLVADIAVDEPICPQGDGSVTLSITALTIDEA